MTIDVSQLVKKFFSWDRGFAFLVMVLIIGATLVGCATKKDLETLSKQSVQGRTEIRSDIETLSKQSVQGRTEIRSDIETLSKQSTQGLTAIKGDIGKLSSDVSAESQEIANLRNALEEGYSQMAEGVKKGIAKVSQDNKECIARALQAEYEIKSNSAYAKEAMALAQTALQNQEYDLAKIYVLNAINHMPYEITYLELYYDLMSNKIPGTLVELRQLINIIDVAVYQINPVSVSKVVSMKQTIMQTIANLERKEKEESNAIYEAELDSMLSELSQGKFSWQKIQKKKGYVDTELMNQRIELIKSILNDGVTQKTQHLQADLMKANLVYQLEITLTAAANSISKAVAITKTSTTEQEQLVIAQNQLQTASSLLAQTWTMDCTNAQGHLRRAEEYQTQIGNVDTMIKKLASTPKYKEVMEIIRQINANYSESYTSRITDIGKKVAEIQKRLAEITDTNYQKEIVEELKKVEQLVQKYNKERYQAYQSWALDELKKCHNEYQATGIHTSNEDGDAMFKNYLLNINPALLTYDMQSLYNSVYQKVYAEVSDKADTQIMKAGNPCKSLEDF